jgi:hypothetical protein
VASLRDAGRAVRQYVPVVPLPGAKAQRNAASGVAPWQDAAARERDGTPARRAGPSLARPGGAPVLQAGRPA